MSNYISYFDLQNPRAQFRKSGTKHGSDFNLYDTPSHKYFKIFFYFNNNDSELSDMDNGLLAPTWLTNNLSPKNYYMYNSAWSYLKMNDENDRADLLEQFVNLLSNISSESPWYFSEISGLDAALERKQVMADKFTIEEARPKISIKCLPDAFDDRIGTLLDMYRTVAWDWQNKREILPANLRKFDMGILVFETLNAPFHMRKGKDINGDVNFSVVMGEEWMSRSSYKYIELHNCEIDYGSSKNLYSTLNNKEGFSPEYTIDIHFDDCYESRYNEFALKEFGDFVFKITQLGDSNINEVEEYVQERYIEYVEGSDINYEDKRIFNSWDAISDDEKKIVEGKVRLKKYPKARPEKNGFLVNATDQLIRTGLDKVNSYLKTKVLGNLYTFSLTRIGNQMKSLAQGNVMGAVRDIQGYINNANVKEQQHFEQARLSPEPGEPTLPTISEDYNLFTNSEYYLGTTGGKMFDEAPTPIEHKVKPIHEKPNIQPGTLSPTFMEPTGYEMGQPSGSLPGEVKPKEQHKQSDMFPRGTQAWTKSNGGAMFEKKKIKPSVKYIGKMFEGGSIANNL